MSCCGRVIAVCAGGSSFLPRRRNSQTPPVRRCDSAVWPVVRLTVSLTGAQVYAELAVARRVASGETFAEIILAGQRATGKLVVVEGHTRATAYCLSRPATAEVAVIVGFAQA